MLWLLFVKFFKDFRGLKGILGTLYVEVAIFSAEIPSESIVLSV